MKNKFKLFGYIVFAMLITLVSCEEESFAISVRVSPANPTVSRGSTQNFTATVSNGNLPQGVTWSVTGSTNWNTSINRYTGVLTVGSNETSSHLTVRATSTLDGWTSGTATVRVSW